MDYNYIIHENDEDNIYLIEITFFGEVMPYGININKDKYHSFYEHIKDSKLIEKITKIEAHYASPQLLLQFKTKQDLLMFKLREIVNGKILIFDETYKGMTNE